MSRIYIPILALLLFSCSNSNTELINLIYSELDKADYKTINLSKITTFKWDRVCILGPYLLQENQDDILGFKAKLLVTGNDGVSTLVFINSNQITTYVNYPRYKGDFLDALSNKPCYEHNEIINFKKLKNKTDQVNEKI